MADDLVYVSSQQTEGAEPALAKPVFLIEHEGKLYLTRAVWEYHAGDDATDAVKVGVGQMRELFDQHADAGVKAAALPPQQHVASSFELSGPKKS
ncbi:hypothetical protein HL653_16090 [Sphingomonas sp. AP4-R1]|uniref:hypothetical protein n=1 Tax=Sphingomonas sp. AP4-R1 TaxID=2735134 RepID=UPI0014933683|nr:hypothetical protein [Sphingomonas sp. AP4-R1]QJU59078.1 hypothetical protein HL653_16090 [Sphingomonas sp. AP4-R1]